MVAILFMGSLSLMRLPREMMSDVSFSWVFLAVAYPGVSAEEIEKNITIKIEEEVSDVDHIKKITSETREGMSFVSVQFKDDISADTFTRLYQDVRTEFDKVKLPDGALDPWIDDFSTSDFMAIITVVLKGEAEKKELNTTAKRLREKLLDIRDVSKVELVGGHEREIEIALDRLKVESLGVSLGEVADRIRGQNINIPGGTLTTTTREYLIQTLGEVKSSANFGQVIVRKGQGGKTVRVKDLAMINDGYTEANYDVRFNKEQAVSLLLSKSKKGNAIQIVDEVNKIIKEFNQTLPAKLSLQTFNDTTIQIRDIIQILSSNASLGFLFLVLVLFSFLGFRNAIITALGIPITFAITFLFLEYIGESLNGNSLFALVLVLGMIVDHAIVIIENSYRHRQKGLSLMESAEIGTNEVVKPVIAGTLTTVAAFLPLMLLPGIMGKFMRIIPIVVSLALVASTIEALFFLPVHFAEWGTKTKKSTAPFFFTWQTYFKRLIASMFSHRYLTMIGTILIIVITGALTPFIKQDLFSGEDLTQFFLNVHMPIGSPRSMTNKVATKYENCVYPLIGNGEVAGFSTTVGFMQTDTEWLTHGHLAQIVVDITERKEGRTRPISAIMKEIEQKCSHIAGAEKVMYRKLNNGPPMDKPVTFQLMGDSYDDMVSIANEYVYKLKTYKELYNVDHNYVTGVPELIIKLKKEQASELGVTEAWIGSYLRHIFEGMKVTTFYDGDDQVDVVLKYNTPNNITPDYLKNLRIPSPTGNWLPLETVASIEFGQGIADIRRTDHKRTITVSADAHDKKNIRSIIKEIKSSYQTRYEQAFKDIKLKMGGEFEEFDTLLKDILRLFWVGIFLMYIILGTQFKSYLQPFLMIFTIPFSFVGCILFLEISGTPISIIVLFAGVALTGICVNDSIVLISFINKLRNSGNSLKDAVIEASTVRLRPIILTSITTIGGLLPMAIGLGGESPVWKPMSSTIIFGLLFSTMGTLLVIPCAYGILDDFLSLFNRKMKLEGGE